MAASSSAELLPGMQQEDDGKGAGQVEPSLVGFDRAAVVSKKPKVPENYNHLPTKPRLKALKQYVGSFQYRLNLQTSFNAHKLRPLARIMDTARMIVYAPQPIKCVEAVFVALYLTAGLPDVERVPLGFKTELLGQVYQHIVLLVQHGGKWGAFGISRCPNLMNKDMIYDRMSSVIENFKEAYESQGHVVLKIRVGLPVEHSVTSLNFVCWRHLNLNLKFTSWAACVGEIDKHAAKGKRLWDLWILSGKGEDAHNRKAPPVGTKPSPYEKAKKKKKKNLASRDESKAKSIFSIEHSTTSGASPSGEKTISTCAHEEASIKEPEEDQTTEPFSKCCSETTLVAPCPANVGNSKFRNRPKVREVSPPRGAAQGTTSKLMRGVIVDEGAVTESPALRRPKCFSNSGKLATSGARKLSTTRRQVVAHPLLISRIPVHMSYQTLNAVTILRKSPW